MPWRGAGHAETCGQHAVYADVWLRLHRTFSGRTTSKEVGRRPKRPNGTCGLLSEEDAGDGVGGTEQDR